MLSPSKPQIADQADTHLAKSRKTQQEQAATDNDTAVGLPEISPEMAKAIEYEKMDFEELFMGGSDVF